MPNAKDIAKLAPEIAAKYTDELKFFRRTARSTIAIPENIRLVVATEAQTNASVVAMMNASKAYLPASVGVPLLGCSSAR